MFCFFSFHLSRWAALAAIPPPMIMDKSEKEAHFISDNGLIRDWPAEHAARKNVRPWLEKEKETFRDKYVD